jgi:glycosyltransferase 2 family protein
MTDAVHVDAVPRSRLRLLLVLAGLGVSILFGYIAIRDVRWDDTWEALRDTNYWWLIPSLAALGLSIALKALRWQLLFAIGRRPPLVPVTTSLLIGNFFNNVLPARAGEAARVVALRAQVREVPLVEIAGTVVAERMLDVLVLLGLLFVVTPFMPSVGWLAGAAAFAGLAIVGTGVLVVLLAVFGSRPFLWFARVLARLPRVPQAPLEHAAENLVQGLALFRNPRIALTVVPLTIASWVVLAGFFWTLMIGFDLDVGFTAAILVVVATNLVLVLPSSPAALGVFEAATIVALNPFQVSDSEALSYALVTHAVSVIPVLLVGYVVLHWVSVRYSRAPGAPNAEEIAAQGN